MAGSKDTATTPAATTTVATKSRATVPEGPPAGFIEVAPPVARVLKAQAEGTEVAPVYVPDPQADAGWFSTASTAGETVSRSKGD